MPFEKKLAAVGLDPPRDLQRGNWCGIDFDGANLTSCDFSGSDLTGARLGGARIEGARFDQAILGRVIHRFGRDPHLPAETTPIANMRDAVDWVAHRRSWTRPGKRLSDAHLPIGAIFQDAPFAPEMVVIPPGQYLQGDEAKPIGGESRRAVTIDYVLAVGRFQVTFDEWDFAHSTGGVSHVPRDQGWGRGQHPVIDISWRDAKSYAAWLSVASGQPYRLLSEAEWEYACRAGTQTAYWVGSEVTKNQAQFSDGPWGSAGQTTKVGSFPCNAFGLYDMHGNVWEWCEDAWHENLDGAPADGAARTSADTSVPRVRRGGSWYSPPQYTRSANRNRPPPVDRSNDLGFRVARLLKVAPTEPNDF